LKRLVNVRSIRPCTERPLLLLGIMMIRSTPLQPRVLNLRRLVVSEEMILVDLDHSDNLEGAY
jgi:hypothetical protein